MNSIQLIFLFSALLSVALGENIIQLVKRLEQRISTLENEQKTSQTYSGSSDCPADWITFDGSKCVKVIEKKGTEAEAKTNCTELNADSTLMTIESKEEQDFLSNSLKSYKSIANNAWIGLEFNDKSFKWLDGNDIQYENWGENAIKDGSNKCVQMSLADSDIGKWTDDNCQRKYLFVCQLETTKQTNNTSFAKQLENLSKLMAKQQKQINSLIPKGFLYTQLPSQSSPEKLWPQYTWSDVTTQYAGLFFRAEGAGSEVFGKEQAANQTWVSDIRMKSFSMTSWSGGETNYDLVSSLKKEAWTDFSNYKSLYQVKFYTTGGEIRPRNTAVRIWIRV